MAARGIVHFVDEEGNALSGSVKHLKDEKVFVLCTSTPGVKGLSKYVLRLDAKKWGFVLDGTATNAGTFLNQLEISNYPQFYALEALNLITFPPRHPVATTRLVDNRKSPTPRARYFFRVLRDGESHKDGLFPEHLMRTLTVGGHVRSNSKEATKSQCISVMQLDDSNSPLPKTGPGTFKSRIAASLFQYLDRASTQFDKKRTSFRIVFGCLDDVVGSLADYTSVTNNAQTQNWMKPYNECVIQGFVDASGVLAVADVDATAATLQVVQKVAIDMILTARKRQDVQKHVQQQFSWLKSLKAEEKKARRELQQGVLTMKLPERKDRLVTQQLAQFSLSLKLLKAEEQEHRREVEHALARAAVRNQWMNGRLPIELEGLYTHRNLVSTLLQRLHHVAREQAAPNEQASLSKMRGDEKKD